MEHRDIIIITKIISEIDFPKLKEGLRRILPEKTKS